MTAVTHQLENWQKLGSKPISSSPIKSIQLPEGKTAPDQMKCLGGDLYVHIALWKYTSSWFETGPKTLRLTLLPRQYSPATGAEWLYVSKILTYHLPWDTYYRGVRGGSRDTFHVYAEITKRLEQTSMFLLRFPKNFLWEVRVCVCACV